MNFYKYQIFAPVCIEQSVGEMQMFKKVSSTFYGLVLVSRINYLSSRSLRIFFASHSSIGILSSSATDSISPIADHFGVSET